MVCELADHRASHRIAHERDTLDAAIVEESRRGMREVGHIDTARPMPEPVAILKPFRETGPRLERPIRGRGFQQPRGPFTGDVRARRLDFSGPFGIRARMHNPGA